MNKAGLIISLFGGILAIFFSVLLIFTGPVLFIGDDISDFVSEYNQDMAKIWVSLGDYYGADPFLQRDLEDYIDEYAVVLQDVNAGGLEAAGETYDMEAFYDLAGIYEDFEAYLPKLQLGVIACIIASVIGLIGAQVARKYRTVGGVMVILGGGLTLIFSLVASSIIPMALASLLLILGGVLQMAKRQVRPAMVRGQKLVHQSGGISS